MGISQTYASDILEVVIDTGGEFLIDLDGALIFNKLKGTRFARQNPGVEASPFVATLGDGEDDFRRHPEVVGVEPSPFVGRYGEGN